MRHPIEICLRAGEWFEEARGKASARRLRKKTDQKAIWTFLSQGAVGGAFTNFLFLAFIILLYRDGYDPILVLILTPFFLLFGSVYGVAIGLFVWLPGRLFKRRFSFVARVAFATAGASLLSITYLYLTDARDYEHALNWRLGSTSAVGLAVGFATGSLIRPCRLLAFGARDHYYADRNPGSRLATPFGFFLRTASVLGFFEALMALTAWIGDRTGHRPSSAPPEHLPLIVLAVVYFAASSYFSVRTPRKAFVPPIVIFLNLPLVGLIVYLRNLGPLSELVLSNILLAIVGLWVVYGLGRMMAPHSFQRIAIDSRGEAVATRPVIVRRALPVQR